MLLIDAARGKAFSAFLFLGGTQDLNYFTLYYSLETMVFAFPLYFLHISVKRALNITKAALKKIVSNQFRRTEVCFYGLHVFGGDM